MDDMAFPELLEAGMTELSLKTQAHQAGWSLGKSERWDLRVDDGILRFTFAEGVVASCPAQVIGYFDTADDTWMWAWANPHLPDSMKGDALKVRSYGETRGIERLIQPQWKATQMECWQMTALSVMLCEAQGAYRGPEGSAFIFMSFGAVTIAKLDFSNVTSWELARELCEKGKLIKLLMCPRELDGADIAENTTVVPVGIDRLHAEAISTVIGLMKEERVNALQVVPEYEVGLVPSKIRVTAWHTDKGGGFERTIDVW